jgi:hypothetical protein
MHAYIIYRFLAFFISTTYPFFVFTRPARPNSISISHNHTSQLGSLRAPYLDEVLLALLHSGVDRTVASRRFRHEAVRLDVA